MEFGAVVFVRSVGRSSRLGGLRYFVEVYDDPEISEMAKSMIPAILVQM